MGRSDCIYTKNSARPRSDPDRKIYGPDRKIYSPDRKIGSPDRKICGPEQLGGDASENGDFQSRKQRLQGTFFSGALILYSERNEQLGALRQKMAIFKDGNSVCRVHFFFFRSQDRDAFADSRIFRKK